MRARILTIIFSLSALIALASALFLLPNPTLTVKPTPVAPVPTPAAAPPPQAPTLPPLPEVTLKEVPYHTVPEEGLPAAPRSLNEMMRADNARERHVSDEVANGARRAPLPGAPRSFAGAATVTSGSGLLVGAVPVQLFGVKSAGSQRCGPGLGGEASCEALAAQFLKRRAAGGPLNCHAPAPRPGVVVAFAICLDARGDDLGQVLITAGLALADSGQTYDYASAEADARSLKRGLWAYR